MKLSAGLGLYLLLAIPAGAQDVREGSVRFKKEDRTGVMADYNAPKEQTEDALAATLKTAGLGNRHNESGFWKYENAAWPAITPGTADIYFNVERHKGRSVVYMMVSPGNGNFVTSVSNPQVIQNMQAFLTKFSADLTAYQQQVAIAGQQQAVSDANDKVKRADRETDRANRRQKRASREKDKRVQQAGEEQQKLDQMQK